MKMFKASFSIKTASGETIIFNSGYIVIIDNSHFLGYFTHDFVDITFVNNILSFKFVFYNIVIEEFSTKEYIDCFYCPEEYELFSKDQSMILKINEPLTNPIVINSITQKLNLK